MIIRAGLGSLIAPVGTLRVFRFPPLWMGIIHNFRGCTTATVTRTIRMTMSSATISVGVHRRKRIYTWLALLLLL